MNAFRSLARTQVLTLGAAVSTLLLAAGARADFIITNGGFETGTLEPWSAEGSFDTDGAEILPEPHTGDFALHLDAGEYEDQYHVFQAVTPTPVSEILSAGLWSMCPTPRWGMPAIVRFHYEDDTISDQLFALVDEWNYVDATGSLTPGAVLTGFEVVWYGVGDEGPASELFIDDVQVETVPAPGGLAATGVLGLMGARRRR